MYNFIKPKSISEKKLNSYISIIGLAPCKVFSILFDENFIEFELFLKKYNIQKFELESYMNILQAAKLMQVSIEGEILNYQMFKPLFLEGTENKKWSIIQKHQVKMKKGKNISKTYFDIFNKSFIPEDIIHKDQNSWVMYFEKLKGLKINVAELILINQIQDDYKLENTMVNMIISRTFKKCKRWNTKYFELVAKTFAKLSINTVKKADDFFSGRFFANVDNSADYLAALEKELEILEAENG